MFLNIFKEPVGLLKEPTMGETKTLTLICELTPGVRRSQRTQGHMTCSIWQAFLVRRAIGN